MAKRKSLPDPAVLVRDDTNHPTVFSLPFGVSPLVVGHVACEGPHLGFSNRYVAVWMSERSHLSWDNVSDHRDTLVMWDTSYFV